MSKCLTWYTRLKLLKCVCVCCRMQRAVLHRAASRQSADLEGALVEAQLGDLKAACSGLMFAGGRLLLTHGALLTAVKCPSIPQHHGELLSPPDIPALRLSVTRGDRTTNQVGTLSSDTGDRL
jgi:hypothetical protein